MNRLLFVFSDGGETSLAMRAALDCVGLSDIELDAIPLPSSVGEFVRIARSSDAISAFSLNATQAVRAVAIKELSLHTSMRTDGKISLFTEAVSSLYGAKSGYENDGKFGRAAYDSERISELEIERTARAAYEFAQRRGEGVLLVDRANAMLTSRLWRKIVSDINEDYPSVPLKMCDICEFLSEKRDPNAVLLSPKIFGDILWAEFARGGFEALVNDTAQAVYLQNDARSCVEALPHMLSHCFSKDKEADALAAKLSALPQNVPPEQIFALLSK